MYMYYKKKQTWYKMSMNNIYITIVHFKTFIIILFIDFVVRKYGPVTRLNIQSRRMSPVKCDCTRCRASTLVINFKQHSNS